MTRQERQTELIELLLQISRCLKGKMHYHSDLADLSVLQVRLLFYVHQHPHVAMKDIAHYFSIEKPTATSLLDKLVKKQLLSRADDPQDRRIVRISLTSKAEALLAEAKKQQRDTAREMLASLSAADQEELVQILHRVADSLEIPS